MPRSGDGWSCPVPLPDTTLTKWVFNSLQQGYLRETRGESVTILATEGNEETQDKTVMPRGVMSPSLPSRLGNTMWRSPRRWENFIGDCVGHGGIDVKQVMDERGKATRPLGRPETRPRQQHI